MTWTAEGMQLENGAGNLAFAQHQNTQVMAAKGNKVVTGCKVIPDATGASLEVDIEAGTVIANGIVVAVAAKNTPGIDLSTEQGALTAGQSQFVFIHVDSSGVITYTAGVAAASGQQLPAEVPEDEVTLAQVTLSYGDTTIDTVDIEDWKIFVADGQYIAGALQITGSATIRTIAAGVSDYNKFIVSDGGLLKYRTGAEVISDIGFGTITNTPSIDQSLLEASSPTFAAVTSSSYNLSKNIPIYGSERLVGGGAWVSTDEYIEDTSAGGDFAFIYFNYESTISNISIRVEGLGAIGTYTVTLQELVDGGTWTDRGTDGAAYLTGSWVFETFTITPAGVVGGVGSVFRLKFNLTGTGGARIYAIQLDY